MAGISNSGKYDRGSGFGKFLFYDVRVRHDRFFGEHTHDYCKIVPALQYAPYCLAGLVDLQGRGGSKARVRHDMIRTKDMTRRIWS